MNLNILRAASLVTAIAVMLGACDTANAQPSPAPPPIEPLQPRARTGAPNVLLVLVDDAGFAESSTFGGPIPTPNYESLAAQGLRYTRFHTAAICSPTRASLLTGRNHHRVGMASVMNVADGYPGYTSVIPKSAATIGRVLQLNGYSTAWFGKNHVTPDWEISPTGPFDRWPTGLGFDYFFGFMNGATDQFAPSLVEDRQFVEPPSGDPGYILDRDLADHAIHWLREHQGVDPAKPFFVYLAPGSVHAPNQAPAEWIRKFKGQFDAGWDILRAETFAREKRLGIIPAEARITPRPASIPSWDSLSPKEKAVAARLMEVHAAQLAYFDDQFGRVLAELKRSGQLDNTLILYIDGDNGPSGEGTVHGDVMAPYNGEESSVDYMYSQLDKMGGPRTFDNYPVGWAWASATPFQWTKQIASHLGGTRDGLVVAWPGHIRDAGGLRSQYLHVTDVAPTIYEALGITAPTQVDGVEQMTLDGASFVDSFTKADAQSHHASQYYEIAGNRAFYQDGWIAATTPANLPWDSRPPTPPDQFQWELYDLQDDYSEFDDLAQKYPERLAQLKSGFEAAALRNQVLPLDSNMGRRFLNAALRPYTTLGRNYLQYSRTVRWLPDQAFPDLTRKSWQLTVPISQPSARASGTLITQGGWQNGWGLFLFDGKPTFIYRTNCLPEHLWRISGERLSPGRHELVVRFHPDAPAPGAGATVSLAVDARPSVTLHLSSTVAFTFGNEGVGIGRDFGTTLDDSYALPFRFPGELDPVTIRIGDGTR